MRSRQAVKRDLAWLRGANQQKISGVGDFELAEGKLGLGGGRTDFAEWIVAAGIEHHDFLARALERFEHLVHKYATRDLLSSTIDSGVGGCEDIALGRLHTVSRIEYKGQRRSLGLPGELCDG